MSGDHVVTARIVSDAAASADGGAAPEPAGATGSDSSTPTMGAGRNRRRQVAVLATVAAVAAVAVIIVAISVRSGSGYRLAVGSVPAWTAVPAPAIPAGSHLIRYAPAAVVSPITISAQAPMMGALDWTSTPDSLTVQWDVQGIVQSATTSGATLAGPAPTVASAGHGYVVDALTRSANSNTPVTVGGHPAVLSVGAPAADSGILSNRWVSWRLRDGRYVHAWSAGPGANELTTFAGGLAERNQVLPRRIVLGMTLPGLTVESVHHHGHDSNDQPTLNLDWITLCPTTQSPQDHSERAADSCITVSIAHGESVDREIGVMGVDGGVVTLTVGGQNIYTAKNEAHLHVDGKNGPFGVNVWSPDRNPQDLALIALSVRFDPAMASGT